MDIAWLLKSLRELPDGADFTDPVRLQVQAAAATTRDAASPRSISARMSSMCSMPTERRT
jgi:hypothetical protein